MTESSAIKNFPTPDEGKGTTDAGTPWEVTVKSFGGGYSLKLGSVLITYSYYSGGDDEGDWATSSTYTIKKDGETGESSFRTLEENQSSTAADSTTREGALDVATTIAELAGAEAMDVTAFLAALPDKFKNIIDALEGKSKD